MLQTVDGQVYDHPETPARPGLIREALDAAGLVRLVPPTAHDDALLDAVHEPKYREFIRDTCAELDPEVSVTAAGVSMDPGVLERSDPGGAGGVLLVWAGRAANAGDVWGGARSGGRGADGGGPSARRRHGRICAVPAAGASRGA